MTRYTSNGNYKSLRNYPNLHVTNLNDEYSLQDISRKYWENNLVYFKKHNIGLFESSIFIPEAMYPKYNSKFKLHYLEGFFINKFKFKFSHCPKNSFIITIFRNNKCYTRLCYNLRGDYL